MSNTKLKVRLIFGALIIIIGMVILSFDGSQADRLGNWGANWRLAVWGYALMILGSAYIGFMVFARRATDRTFKTALLGKKVLDDE